MNKYLRFILYLVILGVVLPLSLAACTGPVATQVPLTDTAAASTEPAATVTPTLAPTFTPQPGKVLLVAPDGSNPQQVQDVQAVLAELAAPAGWVVESRTGLEASELSSELRVVVFLSAPTNLGELTAAAQQTQFIVVSPVDVQTGNNLSAVRLRVENQAFLAGFISVLLSTDYRAAGLLPVDGPLGADLKDAYINGGQYYCGACAPGWPLYEYYPQVPDLPGSSDGLTWQAAAADLFDNKKVEAYYLAPEAEKPEVIQYLMGKDQFGVTVTVVGAGDPPEELKSQWAVSVRLDVAEALRTLWPEVSIGKGGVTADTPLVLTDLNEDNLGAGRVRLVEELMLEISAGRVHPFSVPLE